MPAAAATAVIHYHVFVSVTPRAPRATVTDVQYTRTGRLAPNLTSAVIRVLRLLLFLDAIKKFYVRTDMHLVSRSVGRERTEV